MHDVCVKYFRNTQYKIRYTLTFINKIRWRCFFEQQRRSGDAKPDQPVRIRKFY